MHFNHQVILHVSLSTKLPSPWMSRNAQRAERQSCSLCRQKKWKENSFTLTTRSWSDAQVLLVSSTQPQRRGASRRDSCFLSSPMQRFLCCSPKKTRRGWGEVGSVREGGGGEDGRREGGWNRYMPIVCGDHFPVCRAGGAGRHSWVSGQRRMKWEESSGIRGVAECGESKSGRAKAREKKNPKFRWGLLPRN